MVKDHSDNKITRHFLLPLHELLFLSCSKGSFICTIPLSGEYSTYNGICYFSCGPLAETRMAQWVHLNAIDEPSPHTHYDGATGSNQFTLSLLALCNKMFISSISMYHNSIPL